MARKIDLGSEIKPRCLNYCDIWDDVQLVNSLWSTLCNHYNMNNLEVGQVISITQDMVNEINRNAKFQSKIPDYPEWFERQIHSSL